MHRRVWLSAVISALLGTLAPISAALAAAPINDDFAARLALQLGHADTRASAEATIEPGESLTPDDPDGLGCGKEGGAAPDGIRMEATMWWSFVGDGGPITISTLNSNFDTVLAVYEAAGGGPLACNDDLQPVDPVRPNLQYRLASELVLESVLGREYAVQVGACTPAEACGAGAGTVTLRVSPPPTNDARAAAIPIAAGPPLVGTNTGAQLAAGEHSVCGLSPYAKTVWFRYTAPARGTAVFSASGFDTVMAVYRAGAGVPLACNDDAVEKQTGGSQIPASQPAGAPFEVEPGEYLIQVGGYHDPGFSTVAARNGPLQVQVQFSEDTDLDDDGVARDRDCDDNNPNVRPGLPEVANDEIDQNCDGIKAFDRDGDGFLAPPAGGDCDDGEPAIYPFAPERAGNGIDEDCDGRDEPRPVLRTIIEMRSSRIDRKADPHTIVTELFLRDVPRGARVRARCTRPRRCRFRLPRRPLRRGAAKRVLARGFRMEVGSKLTVWVVKPGWIGRGKAFRFRFAKKRLEREFCVGAKLRRRPCR